MAIPDDALSDAIKQIPFFQENKDVTGMKNACCYVANPESVSQLAFVSGAITLAAAGVE